MADNDATAGRKARTAEVADDKSVTFTWRDIEWTVSTDYAEYTVDFLESVEEGKTVGMVRGALGDEQWRRVRRMGLRMRDLEELQEKVAVAMGFTDAGESSASSS